MARSARLVSPECPHHVTQRGNRRQDVFRDDQDRLKFIELLGRYTSRYQVEIWSYVLMTNHIHLIAVPHSEEGLRRAIGEAHRRYSRRVNFRQEWRGHLWQGRFASFVMDDEYLLAAARYVELNPVRARLVASPGQYPWSSARAHLQRKDDLLVRVKPLLEMVPDWKAFLRTETEDAIVKQLHLHERTGRPLGADGFVRRLERRLGRLLRRQKPGPKPESQEPVN